MRPTRRHFLGLMGAPCVIPGPLETSERFDSFAVEPGGEPPNEIIARRWPLAAGEVVSVNHDAGTITIRHKPIPYVFVMESMTMIFGVSDRSMLEGRTPGDKVRFTVRRHGRGFMIIRIENCN